MGPIKKIQERMPAINTASLPDIIFMLLFFFMVTTVLREMDLLVKIDLPAAQEVTRLEDKSLVDHIYIGPPIMEEMGAMPRIQLNDQFADVEDIGPWVEESDGRRPDQEVSRVIRSLKVDNATEMELVTGVKQELRRKDALRINYSTKRSE